MASYVAKDPKLSALSAVVRARQSALLASMGDKGSWQMEALRSLIVEAESLENGMKDYLLGKKSRDDGAGHVAAQTHCWRSSRG